MEHKTNGYLRFMTAIDMLTSLITIDVFSLSFTKNIILKSGLDVVRLNSEKRMDYIIFQRMLSDAALFVF